MEDDQRHIHTPEYANEYKSLTFQFLIHKRHRKNYFLFRGISTERTGECKYFLRVFFSDFHPGHENIISDARTMGLGWDWVSLCGKRYRAPLTKFKLPDIRHNIWEYIIWIVCINSRMMKMMMMMIIWWWEWALWTSVSKWEPLERSFSTLQLESRRWPQLKWWWWWWHWW